MAGASRMACAAALDVCWKEQLRDAAAMCCFCLQEEKQRARVEAAQEKQRCVQHALRAGVAHCYRKHDAHGHANRPSTLSSLCVAPPSFQTKVGGGAGKEARTRAGQLS